MAPLDRAPATLAAHREPALDQPPRDREARRKEKRLAGDRGAPTLDVGGCGSDDLFAAEPAQVLDVVLERARLAGAVGRLEAEHQRRRERPRLRRDVARRADLDAALLGDLARDRLLEALARLDEAGERRVAPLRPAGRAAEQHAVAVGH